MQRLGSERVDETIVVHYNSLAFHRACLLLQAAPVPMYVSDMYIRSYVLHYRSERVNEEIIFPRKKDFHAKLQVSYGFLSVTSFNQLLHCNVCTIHV